MNFEFSLLEDSRLAEAYAVLQRVSEKLIKMGRRQRISKTSFETYQRWQSESANYIVTQSNQIAGIVTLCHEVLLDWPEYRQADSVRMIRTLATDPGFAGQGVGAFAVAQAILLCGTQEDIYLDCVSDFLPQYYQSVGFEIIAETERVWPGEEPYQITLLRYQR